MNRGTVSIRAIAASGSALDARIGFNPVALERKDAGRSCANLGWLAGEQYFASTPPAAAVTIQ